MVVQSEKHNGLVLVQDGLVHACSQEQARLQAEIPPRGGAETFAPQGNNARSG